MSDRNHDATGPVTRDLLDRLAAGDESAFGDLLVHFKDRLRRLARTIFHDGRRAGALHEIEDIEQGAVLRLLRALRDQRPAGKKHFLNLITQCLRREVIDLERRVTGPHGGDKAYAQRPGGPLGAEEESILDGRAAPGPGPRTRAAGAEFHEKVGQLPEEEREVFESIHYWGLTHAEIAAAIGVSEKTVYRLSVKAQVRLRELLRGADPAGDPSPPA